MANLCIPAVGRDGAVGALLPADSLLSARRRTIRTVLLDVVVRVCGAATGAPLRQGHSGAPARQLYVIDHVVQVVGEGTSPGTEIRCDLGRSALRRADCWDTGDHDRSEGIALRLQYDLELPDEPRDVEDMRTPANHKRPGNRELLTAELFSVSAGTACRGENSARGWSMATPPYGQPGLSQCELALPQAGHGDRAGPPLSCKCPE